MLDSRSQEQTVARTEDIPSVNTSPADEALLKKYQKYQLQQSRRDFERYKDMQPSEIMAVPPEKYLPIFERTKIPPKDFNALLEIANGIEPLSLLNNRLQSDDESVSPIYHDLDNKLNRLTYQLFFRQREKGSLDKQILQWYSLLGAKEPFPELESYKIRAAVLLINSLKFEEVPEIYTINFGDEIEKEEVEYDKRQLAAELLLDAAYTSVFENQKTENLELCINTARSLLHSVCFIDGELHLQTSAQRSAAAMLQETANAELFFRQNNYLSAEKAKLQHLERLTRPQNNLLFTAFEETCKLAQTDRQVVGERNEFAMRVLLAESADVSQTPCFSRGAFEREDRPYEKSAQTLTDKTAADLIVYIADSTNSQEVQKVPLQVKGHYQPLKKRPYAVSIFSLSLYHEFIPTLQTLVGVIKGEKPGRPEVAKSNIYTIYKMFLKDNPYIRPSDLKVLDTI